MLTRRLRCQTWSTAEEAGPLGSGLLGCGLARAEIIRGTASGQLVEGVVDLLLVVAAPQDEC